MSQAKSSGVQRCKQGSGHYNGKELRLKYIQMILGMGKYCKLHKAAKSHSGSCQSGLV